MHFKVGHEVNKFKPYIRPTLTGERTIWLISRISTSVNLPYLTCIRMPLIPPNIKIQDKKRLHKQMIYETAAVFTIKDNTTQIIKKYKFRVTGDTLKEIVQRAQALKDEIHVTLYEGKSASIDYELGGE
jgi:hypothetical protein